MSRCSCGCHDVEANVEKLQSLLAIESHLDEEMDELERLYQLDQLKYEWLMQEGYPDLCDVIKQQMQKTESLLLMYTPMLKDAFAEKEAHIAHILAVQRQRQLTTHREQRQQHQQLQQEPSQGQIHGMSPEWQFDQDEFLQHHFMITEYQAQSRHTPYFSTNFPRAFRGNSETIRGETEESTSDADDDQNADGNYAFPSQQKEYRELKKRHNRKVIHKSKRWRRKRPLRSKLFSIQRRRSPSNNIFPQYFKSKSKCIKAYCALGQSHHRHSSILQSLQRKKYHFLAKQINLSAQNKTSEGSSHRGKVETNTKQVMKINFSDPKVTLVKRVSRSFVKRRVCCNYDNIKSAKLGNNSKSLQENSPSVLRNHQKQNFPSQDHSTLLFRIPDDILHKGQPNSKFKKPLLQIHEQEALNPDVQNLERGNNSLRLNDTEAGSSNRSIIMQNVSVRLPIDEQVSININDYVSPNWPEGFDLLETNYVRE